MSFRAIRADHRRTSGWNDGATSCFWLSRWPSWSPPWFAVCDRTISSTSRCGTRFAGHDPWFTVFGEFGDAPLNAYGPLFNFLAAVAWVNPLAPKVLFAYAYVPVRNLGDERLHGEFDRPASSR